MWLVPGNQSAAEKFPEQTPSFKQPAHPHPSKSIDTEKTKKDPCLPAPVDVLNLSLDTNEQLAQIRELCRQDLFEWDGCFADAIRLVGAHDEAFRPEHITVSFEDTPFVLPEALARERSRLTLLLEQDARAAGTYLYNGPCVRLIDHGLTPRDASEQKYLHFRLGRLWWFDYAIANQRFGDPHIEQLFGGGLDVRQFVNFELLLRTLSVRASTLSNILTVYVALTTDDGYLVYSQRGDRVASNRNVLMSAVSENLSDEKDALSTADGNKGFFRAAARGIKEELSPALDAAGLAARALLLGLDFHFHGYHPGLLFLVPLPYERKIVETFLRTKKGVDFPEGRPMFVHLEDAGSLRRLLNHSPWYSGGKACVIRTLEYLTAVGEQRGMSMAEIAGFLAHSQNP